MKFLEYINEATNSRIFNQFKKLFDLYLQKLAQLTNPTNQEYCDLLTSVYYPIVAYRFEPTERDSYFDFMMNGTLTLYLNNTLLKSSNRKGYIDQNSIFIEIIKLVEQAFVLIRDIDRLKIDMQYLSNVQVIQYLQVNTELMARKAGSELSVYGGTKIDALYACVFGEKSTEYKSIVELTKKYTIKLNEKYETYVEGAEVFKNPTTREMMDTIHGAGAPYVRFVIDTKKKDVYMWNWMIMHYNVAKELGFQYPCNDNHYLYGVVVVKDKKIFRIDSIDFSTRNEKAIEVLRGLDWIKPRFGNVIHQRLNDRIPALKLNEEYVMMIKGRDTTFSVYVNPDSTDFKELIKEMKNNKNGSGLFVRYLADARSENVFVWDAYAAIHPDVIPYLKKNGYKIGNKIIKDIVPIKNNKLAIYSIPPSYEWMSSYVEVDR